VTCGEDGGMRYEKGGKINVLENKDKERKETGT